MPSPWLGHSGAQVFAPFAPGLKQLSFAYELPLSAFPLTRTLPTGATVLEALVEEPGARVEAPKMRQVDPVIVEGRSFARYLAQDVPARRRLTGDRSHAHRQSAVTLFRARAGGDRGRHVGRLLAHAFARRR